MVRISNKAQMFSLLRRGAFGNFLRIWEDYDSVVDSGYRGKISIRSRERSSTRRSQQVTVDELPDAIAMHQREQNGQGLIFSEAPPDDRLVLQGELIQSEVSYRLYYTFSQKPMKGALEESGRYACGAVACRVLQHYLTPSDYEELQTLLDTYQGAAIEFSAYSVPVGVIPHRKMIVWEVRHY